MKEKIMPLDSLFKINIIGWKNVALSVRTPQQKLAVRNQKQEHATDTDQHELYEQPRFYLLQMLKILVIDIKRELEKFSRILGPKKLSRKFLSLKSFKRNGSMKKTFDEANKKIEHETIQFGLLRKKMFDLVQSVIELRCHVEKGSINAEGFSSVRLNDTHKLADCLTNWTLIRGN